MPADVGEHAVRPLRPPVTGPSLAIELDVLVRAGGATSAGSAPLGSADLAVVGLLELAPEITAAVRSFWADDTVGLPELVELAVRGGSLDAVDYALLRDGLDAAMRAQVDGTAVPLAAGGPLVSPRGSKVAARIDELAHSRARWRIYVELVGDLWRAVGPWWSTEGVELARAGSARIGEALDHGVPWTAIVGDGAVDGAFDGGFDGAFVGAFVGVRRGSDEREQAREQRDVILAVSSLTTGALVVELSGATVVVVGSQAALAVAPEEARGTRERTEPLAQRLRSLGAPARLAVLDLLAAAPSSVGELARRLDLAQPTVSVHVKQLREAGLVRCERQRGHVEVELDRGAVDALCRELGALLDP